jgi:hypothetical protein
LSSIRLNGKAGGAPIDDPEVQQLMAKIRLIVAQYPQQLVFNMDETSLFLKMMPNKGYVSVAEKKTSRIVSPCLSAPMTMEVTRSHFTQSKRS